MRAAEERKEFDERFKEADRLLAQVRRLVFFFFFFFFFL